MSKMGSHGPFGHLKHKSWPKERLGVKLPESTQFPYVQVACNVPLENFQQGLQLFFRLHLNWRSAHKVMGPQSCGNPNFGNFRTPILGVLKQNVILMWASWKGIKYIIKGKVVASPKSRPW